MAESLEGWRGGSGGSRFGAPSRVRMTEKIVEIVTNTKLVVGLKGISQRIP